ncbi:MAG: NAD(P)-dependent oxidoreductase [Pseudomonadota bacterium]
MKILVLGGSGHIGQRLLQVLSATSWANARGASRSAPANGADSLRLDSLRGEELRGALKGFDAVVNCVAGDAGSIAEGARVLTEAALLAGRPRIIHLSTQSVYGLREGRVDENTPLDPSLGWYGKAKCQAESHMHAYAERGGEVITLRPGCVYGPGSELWVGRVGRWLRAGRLGDLGVAGDGWSNLVHVDDVCQAVALSLQMPVAPGNFPIFNLAAPDSPRWNGYFVDLAMLIGATPVRRLGQRQLKLDAWLAGPPLKIAEKLFKRAGIGGIHLPDALPPGLLGLWSQHIQLDAQNASGSLGVAWTPYTSGLRSSADWFMSRYLEAKAPSGEPACSP